MPIRFLAALAILAALQSCKLFRGQDTEENPVSNTPAGGLPPSTAVGCAINFEQTTTTNSPIEASAHWSGGDVPELWAQSFTPSVTGSLSQIELKLVQLQGATLSAPLTLRLTGDCGGNPCSGVLAISDGVNPAVQAIGSLAAPANWDAYVFSSPYEVLAGQKYWWVVSMDHFGEMIRIYRDQSNGLVNEKVKLGTGSLGWFAEYTTYDFAFRATVCGN
ncbi:MAG: hypothetical protein AB7P04_05420 [Bacteriovoracia bacterium]